MSNRFKQILYMYGRYIFSRVFRYALEQEKYEDCEIMKHIAEEDGFSLEYDKEDWITDFWRLGISGETASDNENSYYKDAIKLAGYETD